MYFILQLLFKMLRGIGKQRHLTANITARICFPHSIGIHVKTCITPVYYISVGVKLNVSFITKQTFVYASAENS